MALIHYAPELSMRLARQAYFEANGFGANGGYDEPWVHIKLGRVPVSFPNTEGRVRAVRYHDLHHVLTGYDTDNAGEFEISAWEIAAGCKDFYAAWFLNLSGMAAGVLRCPGRTFRAFVKGRASRTLYGLPLEELLDASVADVRARMGCPATPPAARGTDVLDFIVAATAGAVLGLGFLVLAIPAAPLVLARSYWQQRRGAAR